jgi:uncharacterized protein (DUF58 family)
MARVDVAIKRRVAGVLPGEYRAPGIGTGTELAQLRPYEFGDDARRLDPAASARTGTLHVRQHVPERTLTTWLVSDVSASMAFGTALRLKSDVAEGVGHVVSLLAVRRGGRIGLVRCGAERLLVLPARGGRGAHARVRAALAEGVAPDTRAGTPSSTGSLEDALDRVVRLATQPSLIVIVSDFRDTTPWRRPLRRLAVRHELLAVEVADPREGELHDVGELIVIDPESGELVEAQSSDPAVRAAFAEAERDRQAQLRADLQAAGATRVTLRTDEDWLRALARTFR